jgi:hypothetical protein
VFILLIKQIDVGCIKEFRFVYFCAAASSVDFGCTRSM